MPGTFLVVDDSEGDRYLAERVIRDCGYSEPILEFEDGQEVLDLLGDETRFEAFRDAHRAPYIVLLDINMPRVDGFSVASALEKWQWTHDEGDAFIVMMLTSSSHPRDLERARESKIIKRFATKPLAPDALQSVVNDR